jgi:radical SAM/Cys-rich protein
MDFVELVNGASPISTRILQVNVGLLCNKACSHCHVEAGPNRKELMNRETMNNLIYIADELKPNLVDITGGAPEMNPNIKRFIKKLLERGLNIQLRTNLTALMLDESILKFLTKKKVKLVASLPCYEAAEVDSVRGDGTFIDSIRVLRKLNKAGYGVIPELVLDLVFNPEANFLPPPQANLEKTYHKRLKEDQGVIFTNLITIANMPIGRFKKYLEEKGQFDSYLELLKDTFNPETVDALMCRHQINVNWDGEVYDCDFNLALGSPIKLNKTNINDPNFKTEELIKREISYGEHCLGCTAGQGSSCSGALIE